MHGNLFVLLCSPADKSAVTAKFHTQHIRSSLLTKSPNLDNHHQTYQQREVVDARRLTAMREDALNESLINLARERRRNTQLKQNVQNLLSAHNASEQHLATVQKTAKAKEGNATKKLEMLQELLQAKEKSYANEIAALREALQAKVRATQQELTALKESLHAREKTCMRECADELQTLRQTLLAKDENISRLMQQMNQASATEQTRESPSTDGVSRSYMSLAHTCAPWLRRDALMPSTTIDMVSSRRILMVGLTGWDRWHSMADGTITATHTSGEDYCTLTHPCAPFFLSFYSDLSPDSPSGDSSHINL